jgi:hypothetical protein
VSSVVIGETTLTLCAQRLLFAGRPILFRTNAPKIARYARDFFAQTDDSNLPSAQALATITIYARETDEPCESAPSFRGRGHFAAGRFTLADSFWFNLRTREVHGTCPLSLADDRMRWRAHIFPALLGILSATIDVAPVHAACLARGKHGLLLAGQSGAGKSTLTVAMAKRGYALLSDDWTYLSATGARTNKEEGVEAWGIPVPVKLLPDASRFFPELLDYLPQQSLNGEIAYEVSPGQCFGVSRVLRCPVTVVALLERRKKPGSRIVPITANEAIHHLAREVEPLGGSLARCYEMQIDLIRRLGNASCYRVSFNNPPDNVAEVLDDTLTNLS